MRAALYARVSSEFQKHAGTIQSQVEALRTWLRANRFAEFTEYVDDGVSGKTADRPAWRQLQDAIDANQVTTVVIHSLSRAGRSTADLSRWMKAMTNKGVRVVFLKENIDITQSMGRLIAHIMGAIAEFERERIVERCSDGILRRVASGEKWGGARVYDPGRNGCAKLTEEQRREFHRRIRAGESPSSLARDFKVSRRLVYNLRSKPEHAPGLKTDQPLGA